MNIEEKIKEYTMEAVDVLGITRLLKGGKWVVMPLEEITALIQQEREKAVREFVGTIRLNGYSIENRFESPPENKMSVFVMLELMITAMYNYFGKHLAKESEGK